MSKKQYLLLFLFSIVSIIILSKLTFHRSGDPWVFGVYSLPYFMFLILYVGTALTVGGGFFIFCRRGLSLRTLSRSFKQRVLLVIFSITFTALVGGAALELYLQRNYVRARPSYEALFLEPDRATGWKQVPNLRWQSTGSHWYASEFSVSIVANSEGFRDLPRKEQKPEGCTRVALLGDSFVEAAQVPFDKTAGQVLERKLASMSKGAERHEVLNFGISNFGIGQYLLMWEQYASKFAPDYVFALIAGFHIRRTVEKCELSHYTENRLWVRPTFRLENGALVREPARDFDKFLEVQREIIEKEFNGSRARKREVKFAVGHCIKDFFWRTYFLIVQIQHHYENDAVPKQSPQSRIPEETLLVNLKIIEALGQEVSSSGARLIIADACPYFEKGLADVSSRIRDLCAAKSIGYIPLYEYLSESNKKGVTPCWYHDGHFNEAGNKVFAEAMYDWMKENRSIGKGM